MNIAYQEAIFAEKNGEVPVGAVLIKDNKLIAAAHNQCISLQDPCAHAEIQVLRMAGKILANYRLLGCELYTTLEPCLMCAGAIFQARLSKVFFAATDHKTGVAGGSGLDVFAISKLNHHTDIHSGIMEYECSKLLKQFFSKRRHSLVGHNE